MSDKETWELHYPDEKMPGNEAPIDGKCNAKLRDKRLRELSLVRYCNKTAGMGTTHFGKGTCKWHLGSTEKHTVSAVREQMKDEINTLSARLNEATPIGPPEVEAWLLASKMKQWTLLLEEKLDELNEVLAVTDKAGVERTRALIEIIERAWERFQSALEFMLKYDLKKRVVELEEQQAQLVGAAFMAIILNPTMQLTEAQIDFARNMFAESMNELGPQLEPTWSAGIIEAKVIN
jgi:hypothetical protein